MSEKKLYISEDCPPGYVKCLGEFVNTDYIARIVNGRGGVTLDVVGATYLLDGATIQEVLAAITEARILARRA